MSVQTDTHPRLPARIVTITRFYSGFVNTADSFEIGDHEHEGNASARDYLLPDGYTLDLTPVPRIYDPDRYMCEVVEHQGRAALISMMGKRPTVLLQEVKAAEPEPAAIPFKPGQWIATRTNIQGGANDEITIPIDAVGRVTEVRTHGVSCEFLVDVEGKATFYNGAFIPRHVEDGVIVFVDDDDEHFVFPQKHWREEASRSLTLLGYWDWVAERLESLRPDPEPADDDTDE